ncbi:CxxxxCH/CxxCH domain-containing protein [Streptomyces sp. NPDC021212]
MRKSCSATSCHSSGTPGKKRMIPPQLWQSMSWMACAPDSGVSITGPAS